MIWVLIGALVFAALVLIAKGTIYVLNVFGWFNPMREPFDHHSAEWLKTNAEERDWLRSPKELL